MNHDNILSKLPAQYQEQYHFVKTLSLSATNHVYLLQDNVSEEKLIVKHLSSSSYHQNIYQMLSEIPNQHFLLPTDTLCLEKDIYMFYTYHHPLLFYCAHHGLSLPDIIQLGIFLCQSVETLQLHHIAYVDFSLSNIYVENDGSFLLGDFDSATILPNSKPFQATPSFAAPELFLHHHLTDYSFAQYSIGLLLATLCNQGTIPSVPITGQQFLKQLPKPFPTILSKATQSHPEKRYTDISELRQALLTFPSETVSKCTYLFQPSEKQFTNLLTKTKELKTNSQKNNRISTKSSLMSKYTIQLLALGLTGCILLSLFYVYLHRKPRQNVNFHCNADNSSIQPSKFKKHTNSQNNAVLSSTASNAAIQTDHTIFPKTPSPVTTWDIQNTNAYSLRGAIKQHNISPKNIKIILAGDNDLSNVKDLSSFSSLEELYINNNHLSDLTPISSLTTLHTLVASYNNICDLAFLQNLSNLENLDLSGNKQIQNFDILCSMNSLSLLILSDTNITQKEKEALQNHLSNCKLIF